MISELTVSYSQLIVYNKGIKKPFLDWTDADIKRGYILRDGVISFEAVSDYKCEIAVSSPLHYDENVNSTRTFSLPFKVEAEGIMVSSVGANSLEFTVEPGEYTLYADTVPLGQPKANGLYKVRYELQFVPN
ncbi:competence protein ComJ [Fictibacillus sp. WQ 8-8]|uniref:competence protein ComJ n=1 Tax=unclassified Fictibacillus TaxID=2644029 RepID=UPI0008EC368F|nr:MULTISPECIES: competence protein ComJ [unclassified Fictibacillus]MCQ6265230.1 competence protein ComJ [Fictibacillus sp. WQ 8-8]MED2971907.1 competence protein ComJ [Fictibacillus sp. B-59209]SFD99707.1 Competence protein J (ComJ) [Bacillus sp. OV194]